MVLLGTGYAQAQNVTGPGTVQYALDQPDGARVSLAMVIVGAVNSAGVSVHEWWDNTSPMAAVFSPPSGLVAGQTIDLEGWMTTLPDGRRAILCEQLAFYLDARGSVIRSLPPFKDVVDPGIWPPKGWIAVGPPQSGTSTLSVSGRITVLEDIEPPTGTDPPPVVTVLEPGAGTIPTAKSLADGAQVELSGQIVTAATGQVAPDCIYIQEQNTAVGIRVDTEGVFTAGEEVSVQGAITTVDGERVIQASVVGVTGTAPPLRPTGTISRDLGGGDYAYDPATGAGQQGVYNYGLPEGPVAGVNNIGLLVKTWGIVTQVDPNGSYFYVDDGSRAKDSTQTNGVDNLGVRVTDASGASAPATGSKVEIIGISSCMMLGTEAVRLLCVLSVRNLSVPSTVLYVKPGGAGSQDGSSWDNAMASVQDAIDVEPAREIWVAAGTYGPTPPAQTITLKAGRKLYGGFAGSEIRRVERDASRNVTILDGGGLGSVVTCESGATTDTVIDGFTIRNGIGTPQGQYRYGGGMYCNDSSPTISNNTIMANSGVGGGIYCTTQSSPVIANNKITDNSGAGIYCYQSMPPITGNTIAGNSASNGAGIYFSGSWPTIAGNLITGNIATYNGGGLYCSSGGVITNNTIVDNTAGSNGGGIYCNTTSSLTLTNNIVAFNNSGIRRNTGNPILSNNCVYGNGADYSGLSAGTEDISLDPVLVDRANGNLHIQPNSPCVDHGSNSASGLPSTDIDGQSRILNGTVDSGADESGGCEWYYVTLTTDPPYVPMGEGSLVTVSVKNGNDQAMPGLTVSLAVTDGAITAINGSQFSPGVTSGCGETDTNGNITVVATRETMGKLTMTTTVSNSCKIGQTLESVDIWFYDPEEDWPMFQHDIAHTGVTNCTLPVELEKKWVKTLDGGADWTESLWSSPVVADGIVYVGTDAGMLYAFNAQSGDLIAEWNLNSPIHGTPCVADGKVYVGTSGGYPYDTDPGTLHVLDAVTLSTNWTKAFPGECITGGVTVYDGASYVGTYVGYASAEFGGRLHTIDLTTHNDRANSPATIHYGVDFTTPAIHAGFASGARCYVSDYSCYVTAVQCSNGLYEWEWHRDPWPFYSSPTVSGGYVFVGSHLNGMYRITDAGSNYQEPYPYMYTGAGNVVNSTAAAWDGKLYFGTDSGNMCCIGTSTFTTDDWTTNLGVGAISSSPLISVPTGLLFTGTDSGAVYALDTADGSATLVYDTSQDIGYYACIKSSPAAAYGRLFIVAGDGSNRYLYCFGP